MIDAVYARYSRMRNSPPDPDYAPEKAIRGTTKLNTEADKLAVIFPGWHTHKFPVNHLVKRLNKNGWGVISYDFHDQILEPDDEVVVESFKHIQNKISGELEHLLSKNNYHKLHLIGISLGNVPLTLVADKFSGFTGATIVVGGDDLAVDMWYGLRTVDFRRDFEKMHLSLRKLDAEWQSVAPINHTRNFANKDVSIYMSLNDNFVGTKYQRKLAEKISQVGAVVNIQTSRFGHTISIIRFCLFGPLP